MPLEMRTNRGFTPWLANAKTEIRNSKIPLTDYGLEKPDKSVCVLQFSASMSHVHSEEHVHHASFDIRIGGKIVRTLLDSGGSCSCISRKLATQLNLNWKKSKIPTDESIGGIGGAVSVLGTVTTKVKIGKFQPEQELLVVEGTIAGYDCLLGQDFLVPNGVAIVYSPSTVSVYFSCEEDNLGPKVLHRSLAQSTLTKAKYGVGVTTSGKVTLPISYDPTEQDAEVEPESRKSSSRIKHDISCGKQVAYRVIVTAVNKTAPPPVDPVPACVQKVIDKHSGPEGTLCGAIPPHTHAKGYECHIELIPGAGPVNIRQYRLTPLEKEELMKQIDAFIKKGWIELSSSSWSSSVLFVPKPNNKLRFCVDYR